MSCGLGDEDARKPKRERGDASRELRDALGWNREFDAIPGLANTGALHGAVDEFRGWQ
jgi:hypothetical protein